MTSLGAGPAGPPVRIRPTRRAPTDIPFDFPNEELARTLAAERGEPHWLGAERLAAARLYAALPVEPNLLYTTYVDLRSAAGLDGVRPYVRTAASPASGAGRTTPEGSAGLIELDEDGVLALGLAPEAAARGVILETLGAALTRDPEGLRRQLEGGSTLPSDERLAMLSRAFWSQGVRLVVPDGVRLDQPILVRWRAGAPGRALLTRTLLHVGDGATLSVVEELLPSGPVGISPDDPGTAQALFTGTTEAVVGRDASLTVAGIQEFGPRQISFQHRTAAVSAGGSMRWVLGQLGSRLVKSRIDNRLEGHRSAVEQVEIVFGAEEQAFDLTSYARHIGEDTTGNLLSKGAMLGASRAFFKGLITIERSARGTDSFLGEYGMHLTRHARSVAIPSLEIDQPDCRRAAHSSSVGPIDEAQLFYLQTRGLTVDEARKFIVLGYLEPVVSRVPHAETQQRLRDLIEEKWAASGAGVSATAA